VSTTNKSIEEWISNIRIDLQQNKNYINFILLNIIIFKIFFYIIKALILITVFYFDIKFKE